MPKHFNRETRNLKKKLLALSAVVEERVRQSVESAVRRDTDMARKVYEGDFEIDRAEVEVEEECLKILALYQPVAIDLRFIVAVLKINNDLERIGDLAVNIAEKARILSNLPPVENAFDILAMADKVRVMLELSLDSLVNMDPSLAAKVCAADDEVDDLNRSMLDLVREEIEKRPERAGYLITLLLISRHLERIADLATNIAEDVIYMVEGEIFRHRVKDYKDG